MRMMSSPCRGQRRNVTPGCGTTYPLIPGSLKPNDDTPRAPEF
jgi:hypothetical protein